jgi:hypothetical protein
MSDDYNGTITAAVAEAEIPSESATLVHLSSGVILKTKPVSILLLQNVLLRFPQPEIPVIFDDIRGESIKNPNHPHYVEQVKHNELEKTNAVIDVAAAFGTDVEFAPDSMPKLEDDVWLDDLAYFGIDVADSPRARYLAWLKFFAIVNTDDFNKIATSFSVVVEGSEEGVAKAIEENFPSDEERDTA